MLLENHQQVHHTLFELYLLQDNMLLKKNKQLWHIFLEFYVYQIKLKL